MPKSIAGRVAVVVALVAMAACAPNRPLPDQRITAPPAPRQSLSYINPGTQQPVAPRQNVQAAPVAQDIVLRGVAFAQRGDGRFPPNSTLTVRVYDAAGDINNPVAQQTFNGSGVLPWPYSFNFRQEALAGIRQASLAAQVEGPDGQLIYRSANAVPLIRGGSEDIPMVAVGASGGGFSAAPAPAELDPFTGEPIQRAARSQYGIPDINEVYGAPNFDAPVYPGQSFDSTSFSGPPTNGVF